MQSFKVLLHHRAACRPGGVLVGLFWTDPDEIDRSFPINALRSIAATGGWGGWTIRRILPIGRATAAAAGSPAAFMMHWACELVVDRTVLVYAPPLHERVGPMARPRAAFCRTGLRLAGRPARRSSRPQSRRAAKPMHIRVFPQGGLTYVPARQEPVQ